MQRFVPSTVYHPGAGYEPLVTDNTDGKVHGVTVLGEPGRFYKEAIAYGLAARKCKQAEQRGYWTRATVPPEPTRTLAECVLARYGFGYIAA